MITLNTITLLGYMLAFFAGWFVKEKPLIALALAQISVILVIKGTTIL